MNLKKIIYQIFIIVILLGIFTQETYAFWIFGNKKKQQNIENTSEPLKGYSNSLPDINSHFDYLRNDKTKKMIGTPNTDNIKNEDLIPAPREEKMYIDIIKRIDKQSNYIHDLNDIILILEKIKVSIIEGANTQLFNAQVSALIDNVYYLEKKYSKKPEAKYISYNKTIEISNQAYSVATLRRESTYYANYLSATNEGRIYTPQYINQELEKLLKKINDTLYIIKENPN